MCAAVVLHVNPRGTPPSTHLRLPGARHSVRHRKLCLDQLVQPVHPQPLHLCLLTIHHGHPPGPQTAATDSPRRLHNRRNRAILTPFYPTALLFCAHIHRFHVNVLFPSAERRRELAGYWNEHFAFHCVDVHIVGSFGLVVSVQSFDGYGLLFDSRRDAE
uniref:Uncharacterized protein n=1 Tax=Caenorhabditis japonica TaxID=281687 RepID=A0A8R1EIQ1_CAEJA